MCTEVWINETQSADRNDNEDKETRSVLSVFEAAANIFFVGYVLLKMSIIVGVVDFNGIQQWRYFH